MICKGPALDATPAGAGGEGDIVVAVAGTGDAVEKVLAGGVSALAREGSSATVEDGRVGCVGGVFGPVPVSVGG